MWLNFDYSFKFSSKFFITCLSRCICLNLVGQLSPKTYFGPSCLSPCDCIWFEWGFFVSHNFSYVFKLVRIESSIMSAFCIFIFIPTKSNKQILRRFIYLSIYWQNFVGFINRPSDIVRVFIVMLSLSPWLYKITFCSFRLLLLKCKQFFFSLRIKNFLS